MEYRNASAAVGALMALAALSACTSSGTAVSPNSQGLQTQISTDVAASTGQAVVTDIQETGDDPSGDGTYAAMMKGYGVSASGIVMMPHKNATSVAYGDGPSCTQTGFPEDLRWYCGADTATISNSSPLVADTLIRQRNYEYFAQGVAQSVPDTMTDSVNFGGANGVPVYVAIHRSRWHGVSHRVRNHSVVDFPSFAKDTLMQSTWIGNTLATDTAAYTGTIWSVNYTGVAYDTTYNVIFQRPRGENPFPISGQFRRWANWSYTANGPSTLTGTISRHIVVTYNGTDNAELQVIGTTTLTCTINLVTGDVSACQ